MNPLFSFLLGPLGKAVAVAVIALSVYMKGRVDGSDACDQRWRAEHVETMRQADAERRRLMQDAAELSEKDRKAAEKAAEERAAMEAQAKKKDARLAELLAQKPVFQDCKADDETAKLLNDALKGGDK